MVSATGIVALCCRNGGSQTPDRWLNRSRNTHARVKFEFDDLLLDLEAARNDGTFTKVLSKYTKPLLLIIDEWLLLKLNESESKNLFELIHKRRKKSSTIFCSQFREEGWYDRLGGDDNPLADAIMDRIVYDAYKINIESIDPSKDISMREVYGIDQNMVQ